MSAHRTIKQAAYAFIFLNIVLLAGYGILRVIVPAGPRVIENTPTPIPAFSALEIQPADFIQSGNLVDAVVQIKNPNVRAGVSNLTVNFQFLDSNSQTIISRSVSSYILPGSSQYVAVFNVPTTVPVASVKANIPGTSTFTTVADTYQLPRFSHIMRDRVPRELAGKTYEEQKGLIVNNNPFVFKTVEVVVLAFDASNRVVSIGQTVVGDLLLGEQREFKVQWLYSGQSIERVIAFPTTNIFLKDNIRPVTKDPSLLQ